LHGEVEIRYNNQIVGRLYRGQFIAEMSFITGKAATATVKAKDRVQYIAWLQSEIKALETSDPQIFIQIQGTLGRDLIEKLVVTEQAKV
jgi:CRP-like cAMP-binding protein